MGQNIFNSIQLKKPRKNVFDLTHDHKTTCDMGFLVPTLTMECIPGDKFTIGCESLLRFMPLIAPVMHRMNVTQHYFFVPYRLLWDGWDKWINNQPGATLHPTIRYADDNTPNTLPLTMLMNYMGIVPPNNAVVDDSAVQISALMLSAYQMIYQEYYRDQNLQADVDYKLISGDNTLNADLTQIRKRAWQHDYFTAALPFAQKGAAVTLPLGQFNDVVVGFNDPLFTDGDPAAWTGNNPNVGGQSTLVNAVQDPELPESFPTLGKLYAKTSDLEPQATTINDLRRAFRLQEWLEKNARGGTRYTESILIHFGVRSPDSRLQRPEYITGTKSPVVISEILNTTGDIGLPGGLPQGNMAGHGISVTQGKYGGYFCQEHGCIIGIMSVMPLPAYQQGLPKHFSKFADSFEYFWPEFANIGEQAVTNNELYLRPDNIPAGKDTFGYIPRYGEYKYMPSRVSGYFQTSLNFWHLGRIFTSPPNLNGTFIECDPGKRIFAVVDPNEHSLLVHILHKIKAVRGMPKFGTPSF